MESYYQFIEVPEKKYQNFLKEDNIDKLNKYKVSGNEIVNHNQTTLFMILCRFSRMIPLSEFKIKNLINKGVDLNKHNIYKDTALILAAWKHSTSTENTINILIDSKADINKQDENGYNALYLALSSNASSNIIKKIIDFGADISPIINYKRMWKINIQERFIQHLDLSNYNILIELLRHDISLLTHVKWKLLNQLSEQYKMDSLILDWITLVHKYNHILEELFQNDTECVNYFSLLYIN